MNLAVAQPIELVEYKEVTDYTAIMADLAIEGVPNILDFNDNQPVLFTQRDARVT